MDKLSPVLPPISIKAEPLFTIPTPIGDFNFTNSMLFTLVVIIGVTLFFALALRRTSLVPRGAQNVAETVVEFLLGLVEGTAGRRVGRRIFPLIATLFIFIIVANWSGLLPGVGTIGGCYTEHPAAVSPGSTAAQEPAASGGLPKFDCGPGKTFIPFLRPANADLNTTLAMALIAVVVVQIAGISAHGVGGYLKELTTPIFLAPIHITGELARVISLSFRLFGNIFGGEVLVTVMYVLFGTLFIGFGTVIFLGLELLFGFIQALLFSILTLVYITSAMAGHSGGGGGGHEAPAGTVEAMGQHAAEMIGGVGGPDDKGGDHPEGGGTVHHMGG
jgi:F-type H+-transporting ATPase subunit a